MPEGPTIVWFRTDLRLEDNPALIAAARVGGPVIPVFIWAPEEEAPWEPGAASNWWLHQSLKALAKALRAKRSRLIIRRGPAADALEALARETGAKRVAWNRRYEPVVRARDETLESRLRAKGIEVETFPGALLFDPWEITTKQGGSYRVFTPFWRACVKREPLPDPEPSPKSLPAPSQWPDSLPLEALELEPKVDWAAGIRAAWTPGEKGACARLDAFIDETVADYPKARDIPGVEGTSRLSPHLHFGEVSPRQVWHAVHQAAALDATPGTLAGAEAYLRQLYWREFAHHVLHHAPHTPESPLREEFASFPWRDDAAALRAWQRGATGYPYIDAGMRELWATGWMHNRVRMAVASFLVKDLLIPWQVGARWFWDTLVDADLANNTFGWQWTAGCGADAAPYFRIFNPVSQGTRFDGDGAYVRRWVPELAKLPERYLHQPWTAPASVLDDAGVALGRDYPLPMADHSEARQTALDAYQVLKGR